MNTVHGNDFSFFEEVAELLQEEPIGALDAECAGQLAAIGLVSGQPFTPDDRMRTILTDAAKIGAGMARTIAYAPKDPEAKLYGSWKNAFVGGSHEFLRDGGRSYRLHVDANPPAKNFWAVDVYDTQTRSLLQVPSTIWPALASNSGTLRVNDDGSYDLYFGPTAPLGKETNWVETIPGKSWFQLFRLYGPLQEWFDQTWKLNEFEPLS